MFKILLLQCVEEKCMFDFPLENCLTSRSEYFPILIFFRFNQTNQKKKQIPSLYPFLMTFKDRLFLSNKGYYPCQKNQNIYMLTPKQNQTHTHTHTLGTACFHLLEPEANCGSLSKRERLFKVLSVAGKTER